MNTLDAKNKMIDISIIIVNYNLSKEIENCLDSLMQVNSLKTINYEIIIVDNNSPEKKLPEVQKKFKNNSSIYFYYLDENLGFGKGCNYGFSKSLGQFICFLNPDTVIKDDIFIPIISLLKSNSLIGIVAPKQQSKPPLFDFSAGFYPNILFECFNLFGIGVFFEAFIISLLTKIKKNKSLEVDWILGAAIFIKAELFNHVNGFDSDYFMFSEEVDLCKRIKNLGYKIIYCPWLKIHHIGSVSGKKDYTLYTIRTYSSKNIYILKHYKSLYRIIMRSMLYVQLFSQILIWTFLMPQNKIKSKQKINAFLYLIKNNLQMSQKLS